MPPFSVGFAQVEHRLGIVRRRLNLLALQDALYKSGALVALAAALLVAVALRGRATFFAVAVWAAVAAVALALIVAALRLRRSWRSLDQVVRWADRQAALEDRLATLLLDPRRNSASRFEELLLEQVLAATPRWDVDTLAPRRVPRSAYVLLAALGALIATSFFVRPPAVPQSAAAPAPPHAQASEEANAAQRRQAQSQTVGEALRRGSDAAQAARVSGTGTGEDLTQLAAASSGQSGGAEHTRSTARLGEHGSPVSAAHPGQHPGANQQDRSAEGSSSIARQAPDGLSQKLQDAIREAMGAERSDAGKTGSRAARAEEDRKADPGSANRQTSERSGTRADNPQTGTASRPTGASGSMPGTGAAAGAGKEPAQAESELFGQPAGARPDKPESQRLAIKLGAFTTMAPDQVEPQRPPPPIGDLPAGTAGHNPPPALSEEQIPDAPQQKADVAPEHETVVRRIFTRE